MVLAAPHSSFASDNASGVHPVVLAALAEANDGHALAYGDDPITPRAVAALREVFGGPAEVVFTWGGTGANVVGLQCLLSPCEARICAAAAHIHVEQRGAPERFTERNLLLVLAHDGKLTPEQDAAQLHG